MTKRRTWPWLLALLAACTPPAAVDDTVPLAPPDTLSPPTTTRPAPTTTLDIERVSLLRVDASTLEPLPGFQAIPAGDWIDWYSSSVSENGDWMAVSVGDENRGTAELRLIDLRDWQQVQSWDLPSGGWLGATNAGAVYNVNPYPPLEGLTVFTPGNDRAQRFADLPDNFAAWYGTEMTESRISMLGRLLEDVEVNGGVATDQPTGPAVLISVHLATNQVLELDLAGVEIGTVEERQLDEETTGVIDVSPAIIWDHTRHRAVIVEAERDILTEVDLETGVMSEHRFGPRGGDVARATIVPDPTTELYAGSRRTGVISPDGTTIYLATSDGGFVQDESGGWGISYSPSGITAIDTATWTVVGDLAEPIGDLSLSPDGSRLVGSGDTYSWTPGSESYEFESHGLYVIDTQSLGVVAHHLEDPEQNFGNFSFDPTSQVAYLTRWGPSATLVALDLSTGEVVATAVTGEPSMFGPVGVMATAAP